MKPLAAWLRNAGAIIQTCHSGATLAAHRGPHQMAGVPGMAKLMAFTMMNRTLLAAAAAWPYPCLQD